MDEMKAVGITAAVSSGLAVLLLIGMLAPMTNSTLIPHQESDSFWVYSYGSYFIDENFYANERWVVDFSSSYGIDAYLLTYSQYQDYMYSGYINTYTYYDSGTSGHFDLVVASSGTYYVVFISNYYDSYVTVSMTEYRFP